MQQTRKSPTNRVSEPQDPLQFKKVNPNAPSLSKANSYQHFLSQGQPHEKVSLLALKLQHTNMGYRNQSQKESQLATNNSAYYNSTNRSFNAGKKVQYRLK